MSVLSCAHVHTTFCDGKTPAADMARTAYEKGFVSLGFSSHAPQLFDPGYCVPPSQEEAYKAQIRALRAEYAGRMRIYLGIEQDAFACVTPADYEYWIASVHYLPLHGEYVAIDGEPEDFLRCVNESDGGDAMRTARRYYDLVRQYVTRDHPPIIGHFDLIRKNNARLHLIDESSPAYRALALETLEALKDTGALLEVNTNPLIKGRLPTPYPDAFLLAAWRQWGGEVIINSDCHDARYLGAYFDEAEKMLLSLGYDHAVRLGKTELWERYSIGAE